MLNDAQKQTVEMLQGKLYYSLSSLKKELTLPEFKFISDSVLGVIKSKSVIVNKIAMSLSEAISMKKTNERLCRNLKNPKLTEKIRTHILDNQCSKINKESYIIIDDSDIVKSCAKKMEGLSYVRDGSKGTYNKLGYSLLNIIAASETDNGYHLLPMSSDLFAKNLEIESISQILEDRLTEITIKTNNQATYMFDRGFDDRKMLNYLRGNENSFIVRSKGKRGLIVNDNEISFNQAVKSLKLYHKIPTGKKGKFFKCGIMRVGVRTDPHPKKNPERVDLWLVVAKYPKNKDGKAGYFYHLCDFPGENLSEIEIMDKAIHAYKLRWKIEEVHRHLKQSYGWENIRLMSYEALKNMNQILLLAMCYIYSLKDIVVRLSEAFPHIMIYSEKKWKEIFQFSYYKLADLVDLCLVYTKRYKIIKFKWPKHSSDQLTIPGL